MKCKPEGVPQEDMGAFDIPLKAKTAGPIVGITLETQAWANSVAARSSCPGCASVGGLLWLLAGTPGPWAS